MPHSFSIHGKAFFLAHGHQHLVAGHLHFGISRRDQTAPALVVVDRLDDLEAHAGELAARMQEGLGHVVVEDGDALVNGVFLLPGAGLHFLEARAHHDLHVLGAESSCGPAAVHRGIAAAEHDDALLDTGDVAEGHAGKPVDTQVDVGRGLVAPWHLQITPTGRATTDEDRVVILRQQGLHRIDALGPARKSTPSDRT
jgi:hypothetical protein